MVGCAATLDYNIVLGTILPPNSNSKENKLLSHLSMLKSPRLIKINFRLSPLRSANRDLPILLSQTIHFQTSRLPEFCVFVNLWLPVLLSPLHPAPPLRPATPRAPRCRCSRDPPRWRAAAGDGTATTATDGRARRAAGPGRSSSLLGRLVVILKMS